MKKVKISIIVPVYNVEEYLSKCLDSLVHQTLKDIEIIIVNDGTKDNSEQIIKEYLKKYSFIKYYKKENGGLSSARNYGMKYATGEFIGFVDSDDYVELNMFEELYDKAKLTGADIVCSGIVYHYNNHVDNAYINHPEYFDVSVKENPMLLLESRAVTWNKIYRKCLWDNFEFPNQHFEDSATTYNIMYTANKISCVNKPLYNYIKERPGAITNQISDKIYDIFKSCDSILNFYKSKNDYKKMEDVIFEACIFQISLRLPVLKSSKHINDGLKYIDYARKYLDKNFPLWRSQIFVENEHNKNKKKRYKICIKYRSFYALIYFLDKLKRCLGGRNR